MRHKEDHERAGRKRDARGDEEEAHPADRVGEHLEIGALDVERLLRALPKEGERDEVGEQPGAEQQARQAGAEQARVFARSSERKIIVATNVAETSLTIPGIKYVVDSGLARILRYSPRSRTTSLPVVPVSRSSCDQRKGRCGRVSNGICIRLYDEEDYGSRPLFTMPEILRSNLAEVILRMIAFGLGTMPAMIATGVSASKLAQFMSRRRVGVGLLILDPSAEPDAIGIAAAGSPHDAETVYRHLWLGELKRRHDTGRLGANDFIDAALAWLENSALDRDGFRIAWQDVFRENEGIVLIGRDGLPRLRIEQPPFFLQAS